MQLDAFSECFSELHDSRQSAKISYPLFDILFLTVCAVIGGSEGWEDIEDFGQAHSRWLQDKGLFRGLGSNGTKNQRKKNIRTFHRIALKSSGTETYASKMPL